MVASTKFTENVTVFLIICTKNIKKKQNQYIMNSCLLLMFLDTTRAI